MSGMSISPSALEPPSDVNTTEAPGIQQKGNAPLCIALGLIFLLVGFYFLVLSPGSEVAALDVPGFESFNSVVNIQKLTLGETSSIVGAIFLAAGIRPR